MADEYSRYSLALNYPKLYGMVVQHQVGNSFENKKPLFFLGWTVGRVVDCGGLENH